MAHSENTTTLLAQGQGLRNDSITAKDIANLRHNSSNESSIDYVCTLPALSRGFCIVAIGFNGTMKDATAGAGTLPRHRLYHR